MLSYYILPGGARLRNPLKISNLYRPEQCQAKTAPDVSQRRLMLVPMLGSDQNGVRDFRLCLHSLLSRDPCQRVEQGVECVRATR